MITRAMAVEIKAIQWRCKRAGWLRRLWLKAWLPADSDVRGMLGLFSDVIYIDGTSVKSVSSLAKWRKFRMHERTHVWQRMRDGWLRFNAAYVYDWIKGVIRRLSPYAAYRAIRHEVEAREAEAYA